MVQTIIGSGGSIGIPLARELRTYTDRIRLVSRHPQRVNPTDELVAGDVTDRDFLFKAIAGSEVVYVTVGFAYNLKTWQTTWPRFMRDVIDGCIRHGARLVFFDNMYLYARTSVPFMTEDSPIEPPSEKGKVRARIFDMLMDDINKNNVVALVARAADFYGPENANSALGLMVAENLLKGKKAQAFGDIGKIHTFTYTPDAAKATALLGNTPDAFNQVWHMPTTRDRLTMRNWIELIAQAIGTEPRVQTVPTWMMRLLGIFVPIMREFPEMLYQYEQDYVFDSGKIEKRFGLRATDPAEGVRAMIADLRMNTGTAKS
jgi:nucleoside-diphosphate-sugar epimerase